MFSCTTSLKSISPISLRTHIFWKQSSLWITSITCLSSLFRWSVMLTSYLLIISSLIKIIILSKIASIHALKFSLPTLEFMWYLSTLALVIIKFLIKFKNFNKFIRWDFYVVDKEEDYVNLGDVPHKIIIFLFSGKNYNIYVLGYHIDLFNVCLL